MNSTTMNARQINKVGVLGSGVMGAGIAAHLANAGIPVVLLDIVPPDLSKIEKAKPAALMSAGAARLITTGTFETDLGKLADCDWIVEAVLDARSAYKKS